MAYGCSFVFDLNNTPRLFYQAGYLVDDKWHSQILQKETLDCSSPVEWKATGIERGSHTLCANRVRSPHVLFTASVWRMYFAGTAKDEISRILIASSKDLKHWTISDTPILEPSIFSREDGKSVTGLADPSVIALPNGGWRMYISAELGNQHNQEIMSVTSTDGLSWIPDIGVRIRNGKPGMLEVANNPSALHHNGEIWLWFRGSDLMPLNSNLFIAQSKDGLIFSAPKKVLTYSKWHPYERHGIGFPHITTTKQGFRMYYTGYWGNWNCKTTVDYYRKRRI
jgi:predicted GH43/DUF377 family glycosyl hydrolase